MTEFLNKPYRFELRDEYTKGPNPRPLPTIKASYYHGKSATQKVLNTSVVALPFYPAATIQGAYRAS